MSYAAFSVVFGEQPSAAKWNILGSNDSSFNDGTGIGTDAIKAASMFYGMVRNRQGGASGDATWQTAGTTTTATDAKDVFIQGGCVNGSNVTVTFPTAYNQVPLVFCTVASAANQNVFARTTGISTSQFTISIFQTSGAAGTGENINWLSIGQ